MLRNGDVPARNLVFTTKKNNREPDDELFTMQTNELQIWDAKRKEMEVEGLRENSSRTPTQTISKRIEILLDKDSSGEGFGFFLRGGAYCHPDGSLPLTITKVIPGSPADREGSLQVGDRIIEINGLDMSRFTVQQAAAILNEAENDVILLVDYDVEVLEWISNATGPVVVEIEKPVGKVLDITLSSTCWNGVDVIYIDSVYEAGTADRSGALHIGDHVTWIDGIPVGRKSVDEATALLESNKTERIQLEIFPVSAQVKRDTHSCFQMTNPTVLGSTCLPAYDSALMLEFENALVNGTVISSDDLSTCSAGQRLQQVFNQGAARLLPPPCGTRSLTTLRGYTPPLQMATPRSATPPNNFPLRSFSPQSASHYPIRGSTTPNSLLSPARSATPPVAFRAKRIISSSLGGLPGPGSGGPARTSVRRFSKASLNQVDVAEVVLFGGSDGFGLDIEAVSVDDTTEKGSTGVKWPLVTHVEPKGEADRSGVIQEGDRVQAINGQSLRGRTNDDLQRLLLSCSSGVLRLLIEYDVADSIVVSSGTILVKLATGGGVGFGLSLASPVKRKPGDPLIISDIKKGSVAHRVGALRAGDALLAVDEVDVINSSVDQVTRMLSNYSDIVQLTICKNESSTETPPSNLVTMSVELPVRTGSLLGIVLSTAPGSASRRIIVSDIVEGSLIHRSGALKVGDEVISINGIPVDSRSLDDAQRILSDSTDSVSLKIKRLPLDNARSSRHNGQKAQNSIDSAVESCDSSSTPNSDTAIYAASQGLTTSLSPHPSSPQPHQPPLHPSQRDQQLLQLPHSCNELKIMAEIHSSAEDTFPPKVVAADLSTDGSSDDQLPVHAVPSDDDEWSRLLDELDNEMVDTGDCISDSFSHLSMTIDDSDVRIQSSVTSQCPDVTLVRNDRISEADIANQCSVTSQSCSIKRDVSAISTVAEVNDNCRKTEAQHSRCVAGNANNELDEQKIAQTRKRNEHVANDFKMGSLEVDSSHLRSCTSSETEFENHKTRLAEAILPGIELTPPESKDLSNADELNELEELLESIFTPTPVELLKVILYKVRNIDDFGFSLSDGVYEKGVYVSGVKPGGPASEGLLPYDKILQINQVKTKDLDCHQVVPLIAQSGNCVELIVCRNALASSLPRDRSRDSMASSRDVRAESSPPHSGSTRNASSKVDQLWKPRVRRKVNFLSKNSVF